MQDNKRELSCLSSMLSQLLLPGCETKYLTVSNSIFKYCMEPFTWKQASHRTDVADAPRLARIFLCHFSQKKPHFQIPVRPSVRRQHILNLMMKDFDLSPLADKIIKLLSLPYPPFKRVVCSYLIRYADRISNLNILTTNSFLKDFEDPNPFVRRLVIKTVCHIPCLHELAFQLIPLAFCDNSSYVRSTAASSCIYIVNEDNIESKQNIIDKLYDMIRDPDPSVVSASLAVLDVILQSEGGIVINARLARYLLSRIPDFQDWQFTTVCRVLKKHTPKSENDLLSILNTLDEKLLDLNPLIFISASDLALFYVSSLKENLSSDVIEQISPQIKFLINHSNDELLFEILNIIQKYALINRRCFSPFYKLLFCRFCDPNFIKVKKLQILIHLGTSSNFSEIAEELLVYSSNNIKEVAVQSVKSFIKFVLMHPVSSTVTESFAYLMDIRHNNLNEEILIALCSSKLDEREDFRQVFLPEISKISSSIFTVDGKMALLKLIANYGQYIERAPYVIEDLINDFNNTENESIMMMIILASLKLFLVRPAEMQLLLGQILQIAECSSSLLLNKQSATYRHLLTHVSLSNKILFTNNKVDNPMSCAKSEDIS